MAVWVILPIVLCAVSFIGCWTVYGLALSFNHVCSLNNWEYRNSCQPNETGICCTLENVPTISTSGTNFPENSLFTATINAGSFLFLIFCVFHHAHILDRNSVHSLLSKIAMILGCVVSVGAFMAGNCNPAELVLLHYLGAAVSFVFVCLYMTILTSLTSKCTLTGCERVLYPLRIISSFIQTTATILCILDNVAKQFRLSLYFLSLPGIVTNILLNIFFCVPRTFRQAGVELHEDGIFFIQNDYFFKHISAVFEWFLCVNLELYELSYSVEFYFFSSSMLSVLLAKKEEEKPLILS